MGFRAPLLIFRAGHGTEVREGLRRWGTFVGGAQPREELERTVPGTPGRRAGLFGVELDGTMIGMVNDQSVRVAAKLGFTEVDRFEVYGAEQWFGVWSATTATT